MRYKHVNNINDNKMNDKKYIYIHICTCINAKLSILVNYVISN